MAYEYPAAVIINDTSTVTGRFGKIVAINNAVVATLVAENITGDLTALNLNATAEICGVITSITLTSGTVVAYRL